VLVRGLPSAVAIDAGSRGTCAIGRDLSVYCWGKMSSKDGWVWPEPTELKALSGASAIRMENGEACAERGAAVSCVSFARK
jgi:hypothetical protein